MSGIFPIHILVRHKNNSVQRSRAHEMLIRCNRVMNDSRSRSAVCTYKAFRNGKTTNIVENSG